MRGTLGLVGLLLALAIVGVLVKQQLRSTALPAPVLGASAAASGVPSSTVREQATQTQTQYKQALESALQQPRSLPDDAK